MGALDEAQTGSTPHLVPCELPPKPYPTRLALRLLLLVYWCLVPLLLFRLRKNLGLPFLIGPGLALFVPWITTCVAELNRTPFDFAEGESELVSGFNIEYGSV